MLVLDNEMFLWFVHSALDDMSAILDALGNDDANRRPPLRNANSAVVIVTHCLGVMEYWGGSVIAGREVVRDRPAEFVAQGPVAPLRAAIEHARHRLTADLETLDPTAPPRRPPPDGDPYCQSQSGVALHIYEELAQHLGQLELTRDLVLAGI